MISTKYNDYPQEQIDAKLKQVEEFEARWVKNPQAKLGVNGVLTRDIDKTSGNSDRT